MIYSRPYSQVEPSEGSVEILIDYLNCSFVSYVIVGNVVLHVSITSQDTIKIQLQYKKQPEVFHYETQPIAYSGNSPIPITIHWKNRSEIRIFYDGHKEILENKHTSEVFYISTPVVAPINAPVAFKAPEIIENCTEIVEVRRKWFSDFQKEHYGKNRYTTRRPFTPNEQMLLLQHQLKELSVSLTIKDMADIAIIGSIASKLRALIYFDKESVKKSGNYNPLLFRMADLNGIPLPVYSVSTLSTPILRISAEDKNFLYFPNRPSVIKRSNNDVLTDLQVWLDYDLIQIYSKSNVTPESVSVRELVSLAASSFSGGAHVDSHIDRNLDLLHEARYHEKRGNHHYDISLLRKYLQDIGTVVCEIGDWFFNEDYNHLRVLSDLYST